MTDNNLKMTFDYKYPDEPVLMIYRVTNFGVMFGSEPSISVVKTFVGEEALNLYSKLSGKDIDKIKKDAGCENNNKENI